jgi:hypothetical protein
LLDDATTRDVCKAGQSGQGDQGSEQGSHDGREIAQVGRA